MSYVYANFVAKVGEKEAMIQVYGTRLYARDVIEGLLELPIRFAQRGDVQIKADVKKELENGRLDVYTQPEVANQVFGNIVAFERTIMKPGWLPQSFVSCNGHWSMNMKLEDGSWLYDLSEHEELRIVYNSMQHIEIDLTNDIAGDPDIRREYEELIARYEKRYVRSVMTFENDRIQLNMIGMICFELAAVIAPELPADASLEYVLIRTVLEMPFKKYRNEVAQYLDSYYSEWLGKSIKLFLEANAQLQAGEERSAVYAHVKKKVKTIPLTIDTTKMHHGDEVSGVFGDEVSAEQYVKSVGLEHRGIKVKVNKKISIDLTSWRANAEEQQSVRENIRALVVQLNNQMEEDLVSYENDIVSFSLKDAFAGVLMKQVDGEAYEEKMKAKSALLLGNGR